MAPVKLYVYDLSNGRARRLSQQFLGRQIDGIWHTSVVVFGKEIFYGQGVMMTAPGQSHHGRPLQILDMGETALDEDTFDEYILEMRQHYTADKYHLLDFNCNSFTSDCVGFLTGGSIPAWIKDLPADFLSTPFGAALRPTIDGMFRRPTPQPAFAHPQQPSQAPNGFPVDLLQSTAQRALQGGPAAPASTNGSSTVTSPIHICTNTSAFTSALKAHRAVTAIYTSRTCPPCRMIEPVFESLAHEKSGEGVAFLKIDLGMMGTQDVARMYGVRVTPTFLFFLDGKKIDEMKGANQTELRSQVDLLLYQAFPPHPHASLDLPAIRAISLSPILFKQVPALGTVQNKLLSFVDASSQGNQVARQEAKDTITNSLIKTLKTRFPTGGAPPANLPSISSKDCERWAKTTSFLATILTDAELFPIVDMWRLALLNEGVLNWCTVQATSASGTQTNSQDVVRLVLTRTAQALDGESKTGKAPPKAFVLTSLRMMSNAFASPVLGRACLDHQPGETPSRRQVLTNIVVTTLLHADLAIRTAAASLAFNIAALVQAPLVEKQKGGRRGGDADEAGSGDGEWEVEMVSALLEAIGQEQNEDAVHRLTASLALLLHLSPCYESQLQPLLEVLQAKDALLAKVAAEGGAGKSVVTKKDVVKLIRETAQKLCT